MSSSDWFNLIAGGASIIGLFLAIYFFVRSNNLKSLAYTYKTIQLIDAIPGDKRLTLNFDGQQINKVSLTKIAVWNNSNNVIEESDFARKSPLTINIENPDLELDTYRLYGGEETNNLKFRRLKDKSIGPLFEYFGPQEGFIIIVLHQGDSRTKFNVGGVFKNKAFHKISYVEIVDELGVSIKVYAPMMIPIPFLNNVLNHIIISLLRRFTKEPMWLDKYRSDDWSIGEENLINWIQ